MNDVSLAHLRRAGLDDLREKLDAGLRLDPQDGLRLYRCPDLLAVGLLANRERERRHGDLCCFNRNLHINATNVCEASCIFCSFARLKTGDAEAWTLSIEAAVDRVRALSDVLVTEVHTVNGLNPDLPFSYYTELLRALKAERPDLHIKGFTAVEIHYYAEKYGMSVQAVLEALREAGLDSLPGGGAEIFAERARRKLCHDKVDADGWLEVHRVAHRLGMASNCTMLFGSIETVEERVDHLVRLRELQDESLARSPAAFQTFIPLRFHNEGNRLRRLKSPDGESCLRTIALSRLMLDNIPHIKAYWPMLGLEVAQASLHFGADDLDGTVREEHIYHMAGASTPQGLGRSDLVRLIERAARLPLERDTRYRIVRRDDPARRPAPLPRARLGVVGYRNAWPLVRHLAPLGEPRLGHPYEVARWLAQGEIDLALLPVGALLEDPSLRVVPDLCIGCDGPVDSVLLVAEAPPEEWEEVVLDGVSRTSVLLARLLLSQGPLAGRVRPDLRVIDGPPGCGLERARGRTAALVIGDAARQLPERLSCRVDLGAEWKAWTGLPFVFAVWAGPEGLEPDVVEAVREAGLRGIAELDQAPAADAHYLRERIRFPLDDAAMMGLRRFAALAHRAGLTRHEDIALYPPPRELPAPPPRSDELLRLLLDEPLSELMAAAAALPPAGSSAGEAAPRVLWHGRGERPEDQVQDMREARSAGLSAVEVRRAHPGREQVGEQDDSVVGWLRLVCLARIVLGDLAEVRVDPAWEGQTASQLAMLTGASPIQARPLEDRRSPEATASPAR